MHVRHTFSIYLSHHQKRQGRERGKKNNLNGSGHYTQTYAREWVWNGKHISPFPHLSVLSLSVYNMNSTFKDKPFSYNMASKHEATTLYFYCLMEKKVAIYQNRRKTLWCWTNWNRYIMLEYNIFLKIFQDNLISKLRSIREMYDMNERTNEWMSLSLQEKNYFYSSYT